MFRNGKNLSRVRKPRKNRAPLTEFLPFRRATGMRERGPLGGARRRPGWWREAAGDLKPKTSCRGDLRYGTTTSGPGRGPMAGFEVTLYGRICGDHRGLVFSRYYNSSDSYRGPLGSGWTHSYNVFLRDSSTGTITVKEADGHEVSYARVRARTASSPVGMSTLRDGAVSTRLKG